MPLQSRTPPGRTAGELADPSWTWARYEPDAARPWNLPRAGHLLRRAAFGGTWEQLQRALAEGPQRTSDRLLRPGEDVAGYNKTYDGYEAASTDGASADALRSWWLHRMLRTPHPLLERATLFWHSHFATSNTTVKSAALMQRHVQTLRTHALGNFRALLPAIAHDPALLVWLGAAANRRVRPSDNS